MSSTNERFYVLDEGYRLILAPPPAPDDPMNALYDETIASDALPPEIDRAVRNLTRGWDRDSAPKEASMMVSGMWLSVAPLQGPVGPHFAIRVERAIA